MGNNLVNESFEDTIEVEQDGILFNDTRESEYVRKKIFKFYDRVNYNEIQLGEEFNLLNQRQKDIVLYKFLGSFLERRRDDIIPNSILNTCTFLLQNGSSSGVLYEYDSIYENYIGDVPEEDDMEYDNYNRVKQIFTSLRQTLSNVPGINISRSDNLDFNIMSDEEYDELENLGKKIYKFYDYDAISEEELRHLFDSLTQAEKNSQLRDIIGIYIESFDFDNNIFYETTLKSALLMISEGADIRSITPEIVSTSFGLDLDNTRETLEVIKNDLHNREVIRQQILENTNFPEVLADLISNYDPYARI